MKRILSSVRPTYALAAFALLSLTSCNRGVGCPTNLSLNEILHDGVALVLTLI